MAIDLSRNKAIVAITPRFLGGMLELPIGTTIVGASWERETDCILLTLQDERIPPTAEGACFQRVLPSYRKRTWWPWENDA